MNTNNTNIDRLYELISKELDGSILPLEKEELKELIGFSEENRKIFEQTKHIWEAEPILDVSVNNAWDKLSSKIASENSQRTLTPNRKYWLSMAATFLIGLSIFGIYKFTKNKNITVLSQKEQINNIVLADNTVIDLNKNSSLSYPENFSGELREVNLTGEAFFDVARDEKKPFIIHTKNANITVLGTSFAIKASNGDVVEVIVESGKVKVESTIDPTKSELLIKGESLIYDVKSKKMIKSISNSNQLFWKNKTLVFNKETLKNVLSVLSETYSVSLQVENEVLNECKISVTFKDLKIEEILDIISSTLNLKVNKKDNVFLLEGNGCK